MAAVLITGAAGGIGRALCRAFLTDNWWVVATDVTVSEYAIYLASVFVPADLARLCDEASYREETLSALKEAASKAPLKGPINNAATQILGGVDSLTAAAWRTTLDVNVVAPFLLAQALLPELETNQGSVVNIGSIHERLTKANFVAYATSKAAISGLTRSMAVDLGARVRVNAVAPAATATAMLEAGFEGKPTLRAALDEAHPVGRIARPEEIAEVVQLLLSDKARFLNGAVVPVDGAIGARLHDPD